LLLPRLDARRVAKEIFVQKRMFKVITPIEKKDGQKYWMRLGSGFTNKDESINVYLDAFPVSHGKEITLQLREMTEEDFRRSSEKRASFAPPPSSSLASLPTPTAPAAADSLPF
jgi:protein associated with RNAse G/E